MADTDNERPATALTPEEVRREEELADEFDEEETEAARDERELRDIRRRDETARAEVDEAMRLVYARDAEDQADRLRRDADGKYRDSRYDRARGRRLLDEATARPDEPGADATAAAGRRHERIADHEESSARYDDRVARGYDAEARDQRSQAAQPPAEEAARRPSEPPVASRFVRPKEKRAKKKRQEFRPGELGHVGLGED
jgi:hypothetical protein